MKKYEKPVLKTQSIQLEGIYAASGDGGQDNFVQCPYYVNPSPSDCVSNDHNGNPWSTQNGHCPNRKGGKCTLGVQFSR